MLGKAIVWGRDRPEAITRLAGLLRRIRIGGLHTTLPLGLDICRWDAFRNGEFDTGSLEAWLAERTYLPTSPPELVVQLAGIAARDALSRRAVRSQLPDNAFDGGAWGRAARHENTGRSAR